MRGHLGVSSSDVVREKHKDVHCSIVYNSCKITQSFIYRELA